MPSNSNSTYSELPAIASYDPRMPVADYDPRSRAANQWLVRCALLSRAVLCTRFFYELFDKYMRWEYWAQQIGLEGYSDNVSQFLMVLIVILLIGGLLGVVFGPLLSRRSRLRVPLVITGFCSLLLFQLPASIYFESGGYEICGTVSILGGVLLSVLVSLVRGQ